MPLHLLLPVDILVHYGIGEWRARRLAGAAASCARGLHAAAASSARDVRAAATSDRRLCYPSRAPAACLHLHNHVEGEECLSRVWALSDAGDASAYGDVHVPIIHALVEVRASPPLYHNARSCLVRKPSLLPPRPRAGRS